MLAFIRLSVLWLAVALFAVSCGDEGMQDGLDMCLDVCGRLQECLAEDEFDLKMCEETCRQQLYYDERALDCALQALDMECSASYVKHCNGETGVSWY